MVLENSRHGAEGDDRLILQNAVSVDFADVAAQLGHDVFSGGGWERFSENGTKDR